MTVVSLSCDNMFGDGRIRIGRPRFLFYADDAKISLFWLSV